mmetsp:Transcript_10818/g.23046  ORF Transcript_10818/g.23046 Transcript_10818/m.23046 type:complete len:236 (+) Transcript_10818:424-1131(+)
MSISTTVKVCQGMSRYVNFFNPGYLLARGTYNCPFLTYVKKRVSSLSHHAWFTQKLAESTKILSSNCTICDTFRTPPFACTWPMAAPRSQRVREPKVRVGDTVSVAVRHFGEAYAKSLHGRSWQSDEHMDSGTVTGQAVDRWLVDFLDEGEIITWERFKLQFVSRPESALGVQIEDESDDKQPVEEEQPAADAELPTEQAAPAAACGARKWCWQRPWAWAWTWLCWSWPWPSQRC